MNIFDAFERIYVINLPERRDRLRQTFAELRRVGIERGDARLRIYAGCRPADAGVFPSRGAHGCYLSHLGVLREARRDGLENVLVLEDDLALTRAAFADHARLRDRIAAGEWDFAYPGHVETIAGGAAAQWHETDAPLMCAHFYGVHRRVLPALVDYLEACMRRPPGHPDGGPMHVDGAYSMFRARTEGVVTLIAAPSLGGQRSSRSDIYQNRWYDRTPLLRAVAGIARAARNAGRRVRGARITQEA